MQKLFTIEELALYNGTDDSLPILLGILGSVFDVTKGKSHYGAGGGYNHFAGRCLPCICFWKFYRRWTYRFIARFIQHRGNDVFPLPFQGYDSYPSSFEVFMIIDRIIDLLHIDPKIERTFRQWRRQASQRRTEEMNFESPDQGNRANPVQNPADDRDRALRQYVMPMFHDLNPGIRRLKIEAQQF
ncbi:uncharacterized protein [Gossypium hirsutum]|uniref:Cytochrome b5 heme-binding domain-containing protein n=1 Tax=Gossypium hirsutum TaxID=3635 RepID=A0ABM3AM76_GOSHI|nr:uncharacterized protein LOC107918340 [Gossypium hirsutum]